MRDMVHVLTYSIHTIKFIEVAIIRKELKSSDLMSKAGTRL